MKLWYLIYWLWVAGIVWCMWNRPKTSKKPFLFLLVSTMWPVAVIYVLVEPILKMFVLRRRIRKSAKIIAKCVIDEIEAGNQKKPPL